MSTLKENPLANLVKAAVGLPTTTSSCCGVPPTLTNADAQPSDAQPAEKETGESCGCTKEPASKEPEPPSRKPAPRCCG